MWEILYADVGTDRRGVTEKSTSSGKKGESISKKAKKTEVMVCTREVRVKEDIYLI